MRDSIKRTHDISIWMNKIVLIFWLMVLLAFLGQMLGLFVTAYIYELSDVIDFFFEKLLIPTVIQVILIGSMTYLVKVKKVYMPKMLTIAGTAAAWITVYTHANVPGLQAVFVILLATNLIYFDKTLLRFSLYINVLALASLYIFEEVRVSVSEYERFAYVFMILSGYYIFNLVLDRGSEILNVLKRSAEQERTLMVRSAMMERLTKVDPLTELYNHRTFYEYLDFLYDQSVNYDMPLQLAIFDIDNFKSVNDEFGHDVGDIILKRVAKTIEENVTENEIVARYGGEEFALLLTSKPKEEALLLVEALREKIAATYHEEINRHVTVSIGFQPLEGSLSQEQFFKNADEGLYLAKRSGKNCVKIKGEEYTS